jgi:general secretion pathway protein G
MEMVVVLAILSLLAAVATPYARMTIKRGKEIELRETLRTVRAAIDRLHADMEGVTDKKESKYTSENGYPFSLQVLVDGIEKPGGAVAPGTTGGRRGRRMGEHQAVGVREKKRYLRALPRNPFAPPGAPFEAQWTFVSYQHEAPQIASSSYGTTLAEAQKGKADIYDLHAVTAETALDGTRYADW